MYTSQIVVWYTASGWAFENNAPCMHKLSAPENRSVRNKEGNFIRILLSGAEI